MPRSTPASSRCVRRAFITGPFRVAYGNAVSLLHGTVATPDGWWPNVPLGLLLGCLVLLWGCPVGRDESASLLDSNGAGAALDGHVHACA